MYQANLVGVGGQARARPLSFQRVAKSFQRLGSWRLERSGRGWWDSGRRRRVLLSPVTGSAVGSRLGAQISRLKRRSAERRAASGCRNTPWGSWGTLGHLGGRRGASFAVGLRGDAEPPKQRQLDRVEASRRRDQTSSVLGDARSPAARR